MEHVIEYNIASRNSLPFSTAGYKTHKLYLVTTVWWRNMLSPLRTTLKGYTMLASQLARKMLEEVDFENAAN